MNRTNGNDWAGLIALVIVVAIFFPAVIVLVIKSILFGIIVGLIIVALIVGIYFIARDEGSPF